MEALEWFLLDILSFMLLAALYVSLKPKDWDKDKENQFIKKIGIILLFAIGIILVFSDIPSLILETIDWIFGSSF